MPDYYKSNAIYDELNKVENDFIWVIGNAWLLIYGDKNSIPKVFILVVGKSWVKQAEVIKALRFINSKTSIPFFMIKFDDTDGSKLTKIGFVSSNEKTPTTITLDELKYKFIEVGLDIQDGECHKYLNDKESSSYHKWQRSELGFNITVTDIDLIRIDRKTGRPLEFIELKRSFLDVKKWSPYPDDFANFNLILNTIQLFKDINFYILYNQRITKPNFIDNHDPISIFSYTINNPIVIAREMSFKDFIAGKYKT